MYGRKYSAVVHDVVAQTFRTVVVQDDVVAQIFLAVVIYRTP